MEFLVAGAIAVLTACGVYLSLRGRTFPVVLGLGLLSYAVNLFIVAMGRLQAGLPPLVTDGADGYADPLPQALVLTAIVIGFAATGLIIAVALALRAATGTDHVDGEEPKRVNHALIVPVLLPAACAVLMLLVGDRRVAVAARARAPRVRRARGRRLAARSATPRTGRSPCTGSATGPRRSASRWCSTGSPR